MIVASPAEGGPRRSTTADGDKDFVLEEAIVADFGLVRAWKGDRHGNLVFRDSARNFNPLAAMCGRVTIAEVEELVEPGELEPQRRAHPGRLRAARGRADPGAGRGQADREADGAAAQRAERPEDTPAGGAAAGIAEGDA